MTNPFYIFRDRNSQPILYGAILVFFIIVALLGAFIVSYHLEGNCFSSIVGGENCPGKGLAEIEHHLSLPHIFSQVIPAGLSLFSILLSILSIAGLFIVFRRPIIDSANFLSFSKKRNDTPFSRISPMTIRWLSRFENSPNFF